MEGGGSSLGCNAPLRAYKTPEGAITFDATRGYYDRPLRLACGQCRGCRLRRTRDWAIRAVHESQMHARNSFVTLTYNNEHLPEDQSVDVEHWQKFAKRVRKEYGPFRFLHCGEYGEKTLRPHYHAVIFGLNFHEDRAKIGNPSGHPLYASPTLARLWPWGFSAIGDVTFDSAAYVASYTFKKTKGPAEEAQNQRIDTSTGEVWSVKSPYATMSRNKGLGTTWFEKYRGDLYPHDYAIAKGQKFRPPKFYDRMLEKSDPDLWEEIKEKRKVHVLQSPQELSQARQDTKEEVLRRKAKLYSTRNLS